ncbi:ABC transporter substrate-binding protein [Desulfitobacterium metallireducens]|uniref:ABC transporter substrate-binding protein n=1 Tax=Desulfitobacterium metallireducens DSM 15288 TaxID=871968 RepID=W0EFQ3_9FIRM|nr:ABC transporter substrate-binding protein [Desulfitobacterium metallireducens]AHF08039.1 ABC transporter substrate-binding protein [Desulfitobacterium metallireducens DSM 15288]
MKKGKKLVALALSLVLAGTVALTGCGTNNNASSNTQSKASDTLIYAQGAEPRGLDPALVGDGESAKVMSNIYEGLLKYNKDTTKVEPSLAKSWDVSSDGLSYTFHLQEGVKFQDGTDFNADAVKFNIDRQLPPQVTKDMSYAEFVYGSVKNVEVVDKNTVKINLKEASTPFLSNLAMIMGAPIVSPKALQDNSNNVNQAPVGTGPYKFVKWAKDENIVLVRNDEYWGTKALTKNVIFKFIKDNSARVVALNNGEADMIDGIDATVVKQITDASNKIFQAPGMNINYMAYNTSKKPFNDAKLRTAVSQSINVPEMVKSLYQGYAEPATSILPTFMDGYDKSTAQVAYDPTAAATALKAAGLTSVHMITYTNPRPYNSANGQALAEAIQGYFSKVGITATIDSYDWTTYKQKVKAGDYDICFYGWVGDNGDPDNFMTLLSSTDPGMNVALYRNADFNALIAKGVAAPAGADRNAIYTQLDKIAAKDAVWLPISHAQTLAAYRPNIDGFYYHMTGITPLAGVSKK